MDGSDSLSLASMSDLLDTKSEPLREDVNILKDFIQTYAQRAESDGTRLTQAEQTITKLEVDLQELGRRCVR